jgi:hypothetical protein
VIIAGVVLITLSRRAPAPAAEKKDLRMEEDCADAVPAALRRAV